MSQIRIIGGTWKRSLLQVRQLPDLRPTLVRIRTTLGDWMRPHQPLEMVDLYAGTGSVGFELASQGASRVVLIEQHPLIVADLRANVARLTGAQQRMQVVEGDALGYVDQAVAAVSLVVVDPPFRADFAAIMTRVLASRLCGTHTRVYSEQPKHRSMAPPPGWQVEHSTTCGEVLAQVWSRHTCV